MGQLAAQSCRELRRTPKAHRTALADGASCVQPPSASRPSFLGSVASQAHVQGQAPAAEQRENPDVEHRPLGRVRDDAKTERSRAGKYRATRANGSTHQISAHDDRVDRAPNRAPNPLGRDKSPKSRSTLS